MKTSEQLESLMETLLSVRDARYPEVPDSLLRAVVSAHVEEPDNPTIHRRIRQAIDITMDVPDASD